jgi:hypothetical protein
MLELNQPADYTVQNVSQNAPLLGMGDLVVALLQTSKGLNVLDVKGGQELKCGDFILLTELKLFNC